jgi:hypothetical protein
MPRIAAAVEAWDPTRETQPIHAWLHPWLPYLAIEMAAVYPTIRYAPRELCHPGTSTADVVCLSGAAGLHLCVADMRKIELACPCVYLCVSLLIHQPF